MSGRMQEATQPIVPVAAPPGDLYEAAAAAREEVQDQLSSMIDRRDEAAAQLRQGTTMSDLERTTLERHLQDLNKAVLELEGRLAEAELAQARAAAVPGAITLSQPRPPEPPFEEGMAVGAVFLVFATVIVAIGWIRGLFRRKPQPIVAPFPPALDRRMLQLEQSVDAVAIEIERIGESQRYLSRVFARPEPRRAE